VSLHLCLAKLRICGAELDHRIFQTKYALHLVSSNPEWVQFLTSLLEKEKAPYYCHLSFDVMIGVQLNQLLEVKSK
jgi:hypothetical protein